MGICEIFVKYLTFQMKMEKKDLVTSINKLIKAGKLELKTQVLTLLDSFLSSCQCLINRQRKEKPKESPNITKNVRYQLFWLDVKSKAGITEVTNHYSRDRY